MGWKEKFISKAGKEILIKTIAQVIPTYTMRIFKIPKASCDTINSTLAKYWWEQIKDEKKIHQSNWKKLCTPKKMVAWDFGIFKHLIQFYQLKQAWQLIHNTHSLFYRVYKARYFPNCSFMDAVLGNNPSYVCRSLLAARDIIRMAQFGRLVMAKILKSHLINGCPTNQFSLGKLGQLYL